MPTLELTRYSRKPVFVQAVRVTSDNMEMVAEWCGGEICQTPPKSAPAGETGIEQYIKVDVVRPRQERQTQAFVGDWVLKMKSSFKVYSDNAFTASFDSEA